MFRSTVEAARLDEVLNFPAPPSRLHSCLIIQDGFRSKSAQNQSFLILNKCQSSQIDEPCFCCASIDLWMH